MTAHKLVLSSCSEYFMNVFSNNKKHFQSHAMICLEGLNHADLNNILDYIYQGEVQLHQQELNRFLKIAERLKLEGLIDGEEEEAESTIDKNFEEKHEFSAAKSENKVVRNNEKNQSYQFSLHTLIAWRSWIKKLKSHFLGILMDIYHAIIVKNCSRSLLMPESMWKYILRASLFHAHFVAKISG